MHTGSYESRVASTMCWSNALVSKVLSVKPDILNLTTGTHVKVKTYTELPSESFTYIPPPPHTHTLDFNMVLDLLKTNSMCIRTQVLLQ